MNFARLALRNIQGSSFRSGVVFLCTMVVAGFALAMAIVIQGADQSLRLAMERLGADIVVVPKGSEVRVENALLMGDTVTAWMPAQNVQRVAGIQGVHAASPQTYLASLKGRSCCAVEGMFLIAFDPATDFTVQPWLESNLESSLKPNEAIGGRYVFTPPGDNDLLLYGYHLNLVGNLEPTGTNLDVSLFLTMDAARAMAKASLTEAYEPLVIPEESVSSILVKVNPNQSPYLVADWIGQEVSDVTPLVGLGLFDAFRRQISALLRGMGVVLAVTGGLSLVLLALVFSMVANERRREIGVLTGSGRNKGIRPGLPARGGRHACSGRRRRGHCPGGDGRVPVPQRVDGILWGSLPVPLYRHTRWPDRSWNRALIGLRTSGCVPASFSDQPARAGAGHAGVSR